MIHRGLIISVIQVLHSLIFRPCSPLYSTSLLFRSITECSCWATPLSIRPYLCSHWYSMKMPISVVWCSILCSIVICRKDVASHSRHSSSGCQWVFIRALWSSFSPFSSSLRATSPTSSPSRSQPSLSSSCSIFSQRSRNCNGRYWRQSCCRSWFICSRSWCSRTTSTRVWSHGSSCWK